MSALMAVPTTVTVRMIQERVAAAFGVGRPDLVGTCRARQVARPRQVAMFLSRQLTPRSLPEIGRAFGGRDHTTVMHAIKVIPQHLSRDPELAAQVERLRRDIPLEIPAADAGAVDLAGAQRGRRNDVVRQAKAEGSAVVGEIADLRAALLDAFDEHPVSHGETDEGRVELLISSRGTWSLIEIGRDGTATLSRHGAGWHGSPAAPKPRPCLKCGRAIVSPYPGLCGHCRDENRRVSPLAEGIVG